MIKKLSLMLLLFMILSACSDVEIDQSTDDLASADVLITVSDEAALERTVYFQEGDPLLEVMKEYFQVVTNESDDQIVAIDQFDTREEDLGAYWIYLVNGSRARTSPDQYLIEDGDHIEWIYWPMTSAE